MLLRSNRVNKQAFAQLSRQAELHVKAGAKRLKAVLDEAMCEFAEAIAVGKQPHDAAHALEHKVQARLELAKEAFLLALTVRGYHLAGVYWGRKTSILQMGAKADMPVGVDLEGSDKLIANHMSSRVGDWITKTSKIETKTTVSKFEALYQSALSAAAGDSVGMSPAELAKVILSDGLASNASRAEMMSRTMCVWGVNEGAQAMYKREGVEAKEWLVTEDDVTCEECSAMDGETVGIDDAFGEQETDDTVGGDDALLIEHPPLHPNCRCCLVPSLDINDLAVETFPDHTEPTERSTEDNG